MEDYPDTQKEVTVSMKIEEPDDDELKNVISDLIDALADMIGKTKTYTLKEEG